MDIFYSIYKNGLKIQLYSKLKINYYGFIRLSTAVGKFSNRKHFQEIEDYFAHSPTFLSERSNLSPKLFQMKSVFRDSRYLCNEKTADIIFEALKSNEALNNGVILEINPGFGFLTQHLLSSSELKIKAFEKDTYFYKRLSQLSVKYSGRFELYNVNLLSLRNLCYLDKLDKGSRLKALMEGIDKTEWSDESTIKILGTISGNFFLRYLTLNIIFQEGIVEYGRPQFFLLVDPMLYTSLCPDRPLITPLSVLCRILYDVELLTTVNHRDYLPWIKNPTDSQLKATKHIFRNIDYAKLHLVKITPKSNLFDRIGGIQNLKPLWFFTREICKSRRKRIIPEIEKWVSGCGYRLISLNINAFTIFEDLSPDELLQVFLQFSTWPEFKNSSFITAMESILSKQHVSVEASDQKYEEFLECDKDNNLLEDSDQNFDKLPEYNKDS